MAEMDFTQVEAHLSALAENLASDFGDAVSVTRALWPARRAHGLGDAGQSP